MNLLAGIEQQRIYFNSGATLSYDFRKAQLKKLKSSIIAHEHQLYDALYADLGKCMEECWITENGMVLSEISTALDNLRGWMREQPVATTLVNLPSISRLIKEPMGVVLIVGPWNYPLQLLLNPLVGAIAAGNCVVLKPSEFAPATAQVMKSIIESVFPKEYILYAMGEGAVVIPEIMNHFTFDHVFYTGSTVVGKIIYKMAAERLVPVTLELGGKSPCIVEEDANIKVTARRIAVTKFSNAGQMCVAPDYILVHENKKTELVEELKNVLQQFYGTNAATCYHYGKIINEKQFDRLSGYLQQGAIIYGGQTNREKLFIEPTLLTNVSLNTALMQEEIFGPLLPILTFSSAKEAKAIIAQNPNPLAFYVFTSSRQKEKEWMGGVAFGGGCINNASWHLTNHHLPFGGRGFSGTGAYHGKYSFDTFSHTKSILKTPTWFDPAVKYPPFKGKLKLFKWLIR
jgi:aldehyde dehydrogenase (NAD+)